MKVKRLLCVVLIAIMVFSLGACSDYKLQGTYVDTSTGAMSLVFEGDTMKYVIMGEVMSVGKWSISGDTVTVVYEEKGTKDTFVYDEAADTLDWLGAGVLTYIKK